MFVAYALCVSDLRFETVTMTTTQKVWFERKVDATNMSSILVPGSKLLYSKYRLSLRTTRDREMRKLGKHWDLNMPQSEILLRLDQLQPASTIIIYLFALLVFVGELLM